MLSLPKAIFDEMVFQAQAEAPNECCGLLAGKSGTVSRIYKISNLPGDDSTLADLADLVALKVPPDRRFRYVMDPREQIRAFKAMREEGTELLAIYHSHPHSPAYPSATDVRLAFYPEAHYLIISLKSGTAEMRAFRIIDQEIKEEVIKMLT